MIFLVTLSDLLYYSNSASFLLMEEKSGNQVERERSAAGWVETTTAAFSCLLCCQDLAHLFLMEIFRHLFKF